ncbi:T9SS type A sorting domain-containing protein [Flavilitoribacter nigricans]|nr:T9SS type A sorting domain-containing protein [Flavilitoribacter nigricans]
MCFLATTGGLQAQVCPGDPVPGSQMDLRGNSEYKVGECPANDVQIVSARLSIPGDACNSCTPGTTVTANLIIRITHNTNSQNRYLGVFADLTENFMGGSSSTCSIVRCSGPLAKQSTFDLDFGTVTFTCGSELVLDNILLVWTAANGACPVTPDNNPNGKYCYDNPAIVITPPLNAVIAADCGTGNTADINLTVTGGSGSFSYLWSNGAMTEDLNDVSLGTYSVTVTDNLKNDANGQPCQVTQSITFNGPCCELMVSCSPKTANISCVNPLPEAADTEAEFEAIFGANAITGYPCGPLSITYSDSGTLDYCANGSQIVRTYTVTDGVTTETCTQTFTVVYTPPTLSSCPGNVVKAGCTTQSELNTAWDNWISSIEGVTASGLCNPVVYVSPPVGDLTKPTLCNLTDNTQTVIISADDGCQVVRCTTSFTLQAYPNDLAVDNCPTPVDLDGCTADAAITTAWNNWITELGNMGATGGCSPQVTFDPPLNTLVQPSQCAATDQVISVTVTATDLCDTDDCTTTFTLRAYPDDLALSTCPVETLDGCSTQAQINSAFADWIADIEAMTITGSCSPQLTYDPPLESLVAPTECMGSEQTVNVKIMDLCDNVSCDATFTLQAPPDDLDLDDCPTAVDLDGCTANAAITSAWNTWYTALSNMDATGGCDPQVTFDPPLNTLVQPTQCADQDQVISVTVTATDLCDEQECTTTFTLRAYSDDLVLDDCPAAVDLDGCTPNIEIADEWDNWISALGSMDATGGCDPQVTFDPPLNTLVQPTQCADQDQVISVTVTATDLCDEQECTTTFTLRAYSDDLVLDDCPTAVDLDGCTADAAITSAWNSWYTALSNMDASGGCDPQVTFDPPLNTLVQPTQCAATDQVISVTVTATDLCDEQECTTSFTLRAYPDDLALSTCPEETLDGCSTQAQINSAFADWIADIEAMTVTGSCSPELTYDPPLESLVAPTECMGSEQTVNVKIMDLCENVSCDATFTLQAPPNDLDLDDCPTAVDLDGCTANAAIASAWNTWYTALSNMDATGGCDPQITFDPPLNTLVQPTQCADQDQVISVTVTATDLCDEQECTTTFTLRAYSDDLLLDDCPAAVDLDGCTPNSEIADEWDDWISALASMDATGGCDPQVTFDPPLNTLVQPTQCADQDQVISVTVTATDLCDEQECTTTFTLRAYSDDLVLDDCPAAVDLDGCTPNIEIADEWDDWISALASMDATGGCDPQVTFDPPLNTLVQPTQCAATDQVISVTVTATDLCDEQECTTTFTLRAYPDDLALSTCPEETLDGCSTQAQINSAFADWIADIEAITVTGSCSPELTYDPPLESLVAPTECMGSEQTVNVKIMDLCENVSCDATFTLQAPPNDLDLDDCPTAVDLDGCTANAAIASAWNTWYTALSNMDASGGCDPQVTFDPPLNTLVQPTQCADQDQVISVTVTATDLCDEQECTTTFTLRAYSDDLVLDDCPSNVNLDGCTPNAEIADEWDDWVSALAGMDATGGCDPQVTFDPPLNTLVQPTQCADQDQVISVTVTATDLCDEQECTTTFTLRAYSDDLVLDDCPAAVDLDGCTPNSEIADEWDDWISALAGMDASGGCDPQVTFDPPLNTLVQPTQCADQDQVISVTVTATDLCDEQECTTTFTLRAYSDDLVLDDCPAAVDLDGCTPNSEIADEWDDWISALAGMDATGGCDPQITFDPPLNSLVQPTQCADQDQVISVTVTATDLCDEQECTTTFTLRAYSDDLVLDDCPAAVDLDGCTPNSEIADEWDDWISALAGMDASGGCDPQVTFDPPLNTLVQPTQCADQDQVISVTVTATDLCDEQECTTTFTLRAYSDDLVLDDCPAAVDLDACTIEADITSAWNNWISALSSMDASGGCDPQLTFDPPLNTLVQPEKCVETDQVISVTVTASDLCDEKECTTTFTLRAYANDLQVDCPGDVNLPSCSTEDEISAAYDNWKNTFMVSGGCNTTSNIGQIPDLPDFVCGGEVSLSFTLEATDDCTERSCSASFYVAPAVELSVSCPNDPNLSACATQDEIEAAYQIWKDGFGFQDGCNPISNIDQIPDLPPYVCGAAVNLSFTLEVTDDCRTKSCSATFTVPATTPPSIDEPAKDKVVECDGSGNVEALNAWLADNGGAEASDDCSEVRWENDFDGLSDECGATGSATVTFTAYDNCGLFAQTTATFTIEDTKAPELTGVPEVIPNINCDDPLPPLEVVSATDLCSGDIPVEATVDPYVVDICNGYSITYRWKATDDCGLMTEASRTFQVLPDTKAPVITPLFGDIEDGATMYVQCNNADPDWDPFQIGVDDFDVMDDCSNVSVKFEDVLVEEADCSGYSDFLSKWKCIFTATDDCGNTSTLTFYMVIYDDMPPVFTYFPEDKTIDCDVYPAIEEPIAVDACSGVTLELIENKPEKGGCNYTITRTWIARDGCGRMTSRTQTIYVEDNEAPVILPDHPLIMDLEDGDEVEVDCDMWGTLMTELDEYSIGKIDNCDRTPKVDYMFMTVNNAANCAFAGYTVRTRSMWTVTDECGNSSTFEVIWRLVDNTPPVISGVPADACVTEIPPVPEVTFVDACSYATMSFEESDPIACEDGSGSYILRTWTAEDQCGNVSTASQKLILDDGTGPQINVDYPGFEGVADGGEAIVEAVCTEGYEYALPDLAEFVQTTDNCMAGEVTTTLSLLKEGNCAENGYLYLLELMVEASDLCGNISTYTVSVKVVDNEAPVISGPIEATVNCSDELPDLVAEDACTEIVSLTVEELNEVTEFCGTQSLERLWTATDACGNVSTMVQTLTIVDDEGPELIGLPDDVCDVIPEIPVVTAIDACTGEEAEVSFEEVTEDGPCGDIIRRTWSATDGCGNTSTHTQSIYFNDTEPPVIGFKDPVLRRSAEGRLRLACVDYPEYPAVMPTFGPDALEVSDACTGDVDVSLDIELISLGDCATDGYLSKHLYTWTATDPCGNSAQIALEITFIDNYAPVLVGVPHDLKLDCDDEIPHPATVTAIDDCSEATVSMEESIEYFDGGYAILRTWTSEDACGNSRSETQKIKVYQSEISGTFSSTAKINCGSDGNMLSIAVSGGKEPYTYFWEMVDCDGFITDGQQTKKITYTAGYTTLNFRVRVMDAGGCVAIFETSIECIKEEAPDKVEIINVFGRNLLSGNQDNPTGDKVTLDLTEYRGMNGSFLIVDAANRPVRSFNYQPVPNDPVDFDLEGLAPGVYRLEMRDQPINIFPNPTATNAMIDLSTFSGASGTLIIYDMHGKKAKVMEIDEVTNDLIELKLEQFDAGLYQVSFRSNNGQMVSHKLIIQRP